MSMMNTASKGQKVVRLFLFGAIAIVFLLMVSIASAQSTGVNSDCNQTNGNGFVPLACYSKSPLLNQALSSNSLAAYLNNIFKIVLSVGAILAVLRIAYGGYMYMGSADMWGNKQQAKEIIGDAIIGLLLLFGMYLILFQINPNLLNLNVQKDIQPIQYNNPETNANLQQASTQLQQQNQTNTTAPTTDYTVSLSLAPLQGYDCFPTQMDSRSGYSCLTNSTNCNTLAQKALQTCTQY